MAAAFNYTNTLCSNIHAAVLMSLHSQCHIQATVLIMPSPSHIYAACLTLPRLCHHYHAAALMPQHLCHTELSRSSTGAATLMQQHFWSHIHTATFTPQHSHSSISSAALMLQPYTAAFFHCSHATALAQLLSCCCLCAAPYTQLHFCRSIHTALMLQHLHFCSLV